MNCRMIPAIKIIDRTIMIGQFIGIRISGSFLLRLFAFAFFAIRRIRIPVVPPEMTPPIPRIAANPSILYLAIRM